MPTRKTASGEQASAEDDTTTAAALMNYLALLPNKDIGSQNYIFKKKKPFQVPGSSQSEASLRGFQSFWRKRPCLHCIHACLYSFNSGGQFTAKQPDHVGLWMDCRTIHNTLF